MNSEDKIKIITEIENKIISCKGWQIRLRIELLNRIFYIFKTNYTDLLMFLKLFDDEKVGRSFSMLSKNERINPDFKQYLLNFYRHFLNLLSSAKSLIDHTNTFINRFYEKTSFYNEFKNYIDEHFKNCKFVNFVQQLRNFILHDSLPFIRPFSYIDKDGYTGRLLIDCVKLRSSSYFTNLGKKYILENENIFINKLLDSFFNMENDFYGWVNKRLSELHITELAELSELENLQRSKCDEFEIECHFFYS